MRKQLARGLGNGADMGKVMVLCPACGMGIPLAELAEHRPVCGARCSAMRKKSANKKSIGN